MDGGRVRQVEARAVQGAHFRTFDLVMAALKRREGVDVFGEATDFSPFRTRV